MRRTVNSLLTSACRAIILEKGRALFPCEMTSRRNVTTRFVRFSAWREIKREARVRTLLILLINRCGRERRRGGRGRPRAGSLKRSNRYSRIYDAFNCTCRTCTHIATIASYRFAVTCVTLRNMDRFIRPELQVACARAVSIVSHWGNQLVVQY